MKVLWVFAAVLMLWASTATAFEAENDAEVDADVDVDVDADVDAEQIASANADDEAEADAEEEAAEEADEEADAEAEVPPRVGAKLVRPTIFGSRSQELNIVPKGDLRARSPQEAGYVMPANTAQAQNLAIPNGRLSPLAPFNGKRGVAVVAEPPALPTGRPARHSGMGTAAEAADLAGANSRPSEPTGAPAAVVPNAAGPAPGTPGAGVAGRVARRMGANYGDNKCIRQGGQCQLTSTCGGIVTKGICPGPSFITCCTYTSTACAALKGSCKDTSTCVGSVVRGLCPGGNNIACCTPRLAADGSGNIIASAELAAKMPMQGGNCLANFNGKALADRAMAYSDAYRNHGVRFDAKRPQFGVASPNLKFADAASFVTSVMESLSWNCLFASGRNLPSMIPQMKIRGGFHADPKVGDLVAWAEHVGVVAETCQGNTVRMAAMGEMGAADTGCVNLDNLKTYGKGQFLGFWTPF